MACALGCALGCASGANDRASREELSREAKGDAGVAPSEVDWAAHVGQAVPVKAAPGLQPSAAAAANTPATIVPATMADHAFEGSDTVPVRHLVYRVSFIVAAAGLHGRRPALLAPAGELHVDVAMERLRARFLGPGWPLEEGTEVRLRADVPGVYLFDGIGGRPLPPGQLAGWFQGAETGRAKAVMHVRRDPDDKGSHDRVGPGELLCALLAEWTQQDRDDLLPRCANGALPLGFRFGLWSAELTAIVPLNLPRGKLRADAGQPPEPVSFSFGRPMLDPADLARLVPERVRPDKRVVEVPIGAEGASLEVENLTPARAIVVVSGVPIGWVRPHARVRFAGFTPGFYRVVASRPLGQPLMNPTLVHIPGNLRFGRATPLVSPLAHASSRESR